MKTIAIYDQRMHSIIDPDAKLEKLAGGASHAEGVVYICEDDSVIFSDVSGDRLLRWSATGGRDGKRLFIAAGGSLYGIGLK